MFDNSGLIEIIPDPEEIDSYVELSGRYHLGFEYNDFYVPDLLDDEKALREKVAFYNGLHRQKGVDTLHGVFFDITPFSWDSGIRRHSIYRMQQSVEIAGALGCRGVIFHTNLNPELVDGEKYRRSWLEAMAETMRLLLKQDNSLEIYCENMFDESPRELAELAAMLEGERRFGVCLDIGHVMLTPHDPEGWFQTLAPFIRHFHMNDNHLKRDEHLPLGCGNIEWNRIFQLMEQYGLKDRSVLLEVNGLEKIGKSMDYLCRQVSFLERQRKV
jgi:sugar phosphate isomerase/epimerase